MIRSPVRRRQRRLLPRPPHHIIVSEAPLTAPVKKLERLEPAAPRSLATDPKAPEKARLLPLPAALPPVVSEPAPQEQPAQHMLAKLKPSAMKTFNVLFIVEDRIFNQRKVPPLPPVNYAGLEPTVDSRIPIPRHQPVPPGKRGGYTVETEDAKETSLAVYFTDGNGKFYPVPRKCRSWSR